MSKNGHEPSNNQPIEVFANKFPQHTEDRGTPSVPSLSCCVDVLLSNRCSLSLFLKDVLDFTFLRPVGRLFYDFGPMTKKALHAVSVFPYTTCSV